MLICKTALIRNQLNSIYKEILVNHHYIFNKINSSIVIRWNSTQNHEYVKLHPVEGTRALATNVIYKE